MAGETSGPGPSEQEIRMVALERKFDELLSFVQLIAKRNTEDENQRKEDDKDTSEAEPEGHSNTNATPPRPPTPPKPEGKDSQLDSKIDSLEEKIRLIQGFELFRKHGLFEHVLVPQYDGATQVQGPGVREIQWERRPHDPSANLKKISHWKELADTFLAQYGFNSQIAPDRFDLQRMEKKSNETFREYAQRWREKAARARPPLDEREMIKIFVDTLKNPYFDRMMGLQMQFFVDLIPVGDRIEDALKTKKIVDMTALMALAEQAAKKAPTKRKEGDVQMIGRNNGRPRQVLPTFTMQPIQPRPIQAPAPTQAPAPAPAPQMPARPEGNQPNDNRWLRKEPRQFTPLPMPMTELYPILIEKSLISPIVPKPYNGPQRRDFNPNSACDFHFGEVGHTVENCGQLRHRVQDLIDHGVLKFEGLPNITTNPLPKHPEGVPPGFVTPEFEIFYEDGDPEVHLQKYGEKMALHLENELLMISVFPESLSKQTAAWFYQLRNLTGWDDLVRVFLERYRFNPHSILEYLGLKKDEEPYIIPDPGVGEARRRGSQAPPPNLIITTTVAEEEDAGPMVEGLSIHTIAGGGGFHHHTTDPPLPTGRRRLHAKPQTIPTSPKIDNKTDCSLDNIDNSDEEIELPSDILEALERQDEGSKPNIEELEIVNLANEGEEPREVKIGTRCAAEQKEALIALMQARQTSTATDEARSHFEDQGRGGKAIEGRFPKHSNLFGLGSQYSPGAEEGRKSQNQRTSYSHSWTDSQGYNQIKMAEEDKSKTAFVTHWGTFVYDVMPFGLKNAGATYQRAMVTLFHDMIHHEIEKYQLRLNPNKCAFGVTSGKLLGFIVSGRGIEIDPAKVQAIRSMPAPRTEKEIRSFLGRINYIARFIAQLTATCEPLFKLLRKDVKIKWTEDCQKAFDKIKEYLLNPPILVPPTPGRPLILYLTVQEASMGCMLGQQDETGKKEQAIYYLSKKFTEPETRYLLVEKDVLRTGLGLQEAETVHALLHHLVGIPDGPESNEDVMIVEEDNQGRWKLYFDGAANAVGSGIGAVLVSPKGQQTPIAVKLGFDCTNNMTEYEACIVGLQAGFGIRLRDPKLIPYQRYISRLIPKFKYVTFTYTPRAHNHFADALATLASLIKLVEGDDVRPLRIETRDIPAYCVCIEECMNVEAEIDDKPWYYDIKRFIQDREYPSRATENEKKYIRRMAFQHVQTCHKCQMYQNSKNAPPQYLHTMASPWPFSAWGMDEACSFKNVTQVAVTRFVKNNIICRYGMPEMLITDNASNLNNRMMDQLCQQFKIQHHNSAPYRPKMNGAVEAANKNVKKILSKMTETYKDWHEHLPYALCAYRTSVRTSVGATPYSLVYGMEALEEAEWAQARYEQLNFIDEKRLAALCHGQLYQRRIERAYNKKARPRTFQPGDLVLKKRNMALSDPRGKFAPSYEGPYVVKKAFSGGAIILADMDGEEFRSPINSDSVIKYHV
uniref:Integrase catalytic domain-containing protein n=1 Tax=Fagus sylvatica TaxID=28930 RepID=A0A2N9J5K6_FAGSY